MVFFKLQYHVFCKKKTKPKQSFLKLLFKMFQYEITLRDFQAEY